MILLEHSQRSAFSLRKKIYFASTPCTCIINKKRKKVVHLILGVLFVLVNSTYAHTMYTVVMSDQSHKLHALVLPKLFTNVYLIGMLVLLCLISLDF